MAEVLPVGITGLAVLSALGRGSEPQLAAALSGTAAFGPVRRFDVSGRRVGLAATLDRAGSLSDELAGVVEQACQDAGLTAGQRAATPLLLAVHGHPGAGAEAVRLAERAGLAGAGRVYIGACVSASTAVADAALLIRRGAERVLVAAGYLVESDQFALFDAGQALATDGAVRPFSAGRTGLLLGDAVAAVLLESEAAAAARGRRPATRLVGWGRAGDAYHPCQPAPDGGGLARAVEAALRRAGVAPDALGYINANATGTQLSDAAEAAALRTALGAAADRIPVSSTKAVHGHALEASGLLELVITVLSLQAGKLPVNAGYLGPDPSCPLDVIAGSPRPVASPYALSLNSAFGGANTALLVQAT
ncbi:beta-ketoacyl-[acyl-carrier-protein] synthase family protein [Jatrophihabitans sp.]|uniref:beta-ketoacyl-[acyl-carrier-protein] synthase family protein n=1 Tax=Jatrophihabitans sp. TaxID=1932789 RepID=UPI002C626DBF|nr:beta-ketoacyl synthase N-terminal-like domain-containing protein [Jatrophihabitans sp.]